MPSTVRTRQSSPHPTNAFEPQLPRPLRDTAAVRETLLRELLVPGQGHGGVVGHRNQLDRRLHVVLAQQVDEQSTAVVVRTCSYVAVLGVEQDVPGRSAQVGRFSGGLRKEPARRMTLVGVRCAGSVVMGVALAGWLSCGSPDGVGDRSLPVRCGTVLPGTARTGHRSSRPRPEHRPRSRSDKRRRGAVIPSDNPADTPSAPTSSCTTERRPGPPPAPAFAPRRPQAVASQNAGSRFPHLAVRYSSNARTAWISDRSEDRKLTALRDITQHCHALFFDSPLYARQRARSSRELERLLDVLEAPQSPGTAVAATAVPVGGPGTGTGSPGAGRLGVKVVPRPSVGTPVSSFHSMHLLLTCDPGQSRFTRSRTEFDVPSRFLKVCRYP